MITVEDYREQYAVNHEDIITAAGILTWPMFIKKMGGIKGLLSQLVAWDNYELDEKSTCAEFKEVEAELKNVYDEYAAFHRAHQYPLKVWRVVTLPKGIESLNVQGVGIYWSWDMDAAEAHEGEGRFGHNNWLLEAEVQDGAIDWNGTLLANLEPGNGADECEIRLKSGSMINLVSYQQVSADDNNSWSTHEPIAVNKSGHSQPQADAVVRYDLSRCGTGRPREPHRRGDKRLRQLVLNSLKGE